MSTNNTLFDRIGGEKLRSLIEDFYERVFDDAMIGFLFVGKDKQRLIDKEWEFTAALLGGDVAYTGKPMRKAHARSPIMGGHFERRLQILKETMADHDVDDQVRERWIAHTLSLRSQVTGDKGSECDHDVSAARLSGKKRFVIVNDQNRPNSDD